MNDRVRWGILGTGNIARQFAAGVQLSSGRGVLQAVGSRRADDARAFSSRYQVQSAYGDYLPVLTDGEVDAVYVSLPNSMHHEWTILALQAGKHVLCEKPFASDAAQAEQMFDQAERSGRLVAEAFMYRSHPQMAAVVQAVHDGAIGKLQLIRTSFCFRTTRLDNNIRFRADMAGGGLMDVGCYCVNFMRLIAGAEPLAVEVAGHLHDSGVDDLAAGVLRFDGGVIGSFVCGMQVQADNAAYICGTEGYIEIPVPWKPPARGATYTIGHSIPPRMDLGGAIASPRPTRQTYTIDAPGDLYALEADEFAASVLEGHPPRISRTDSVGNMRVLDQLRKKMGVAH